MQLKCLDYRWLFTIELRAYLGHPVGLIDRLCELHRMTAGLDIVQATLSERFASEHCSPDRGYLDQDPPIDAELELFWFFKAEDSPLVCW